MRDVIDVQENDILWRFYCKRFIIEGREIQPPKNLCRYFWTAVHGFGLWVGRELKLSTLWFTALAITIVIFAIARTTPNTGGLTKGVAFILTILWFTVLLCAICVTASRTVRAIETRAPWVLPIIGGISIICLVTFFSVRAIIRGTFLSGLRDFFSPMPLLLALGVAMVVLMIIASKTSHGRAKQLGRFFETLGAVVIAHKKRFCPGVNPPKGFETTTQTLPSLERKESDGTL